MLKACSGWLYRVRQQAVGPPEGEWLRLDLQCKRNDGEPQEEDAHGRSDGERVRVSWATILKADRLCRERG